MSNSNRTKIFGITISILLIFLVLTGLFGLNKQLGINQESIFWLSRWEMWGVLFLVYLFSRKVEKHDFLIWKEEKKKWIFYVLSVPIILISITILLTPLSLLLKNSGLTSNGKALNSMNDLLCNNLLLLIFTCLTAAFTEEFIFRGYLLPRLEILFKNKWAAILGSAFLFGLVHIGYGNFERMLFPFIIGTIFGFFYYKYRSLTVLIICHFLMDFYSIYGACK
jgi:hypothetical protein